MLARSDRCSGFDFTSRRFPADDDAVGDTSGNYFFNAIPENGFVGNRYQLFSPGVSDRAQTGALPPGELALSYVSMCSANICLSACRQWGDF